MDTTTSYRACGSPFTNSVVGCRASPARKRNFEIEKVGLTRPRDELYARINRRVLEMVDAGLVEEVAGLSAYRHLPALQTVGYREIFQYLDGEISLDRAVELVQRNTRHYAKRQLAYWARDPEIRWIPAV